MNGKMKRCVICHKEKPIEEYYRRLKAADGRQGHCKACSKDANERSRVKQKELRETDKAKPAGPSLVGKFEWVQAVFVTCPHCGRKLEVRLDERE